MNNKSTMTGERALAATPALGSPAPHATYLYAYAALYASLSLAALLLAVAIVFPPSTFPSFAADSHYKYLVPLLVPVSAWFAIANWVGWTYFRFA